MDKLKPPTIPEPYPYRFRTYEDGRKFLESIQNRSITKLDLAVPPFAVVDGKAVISEAWKNAPYELGIMKSQELVDA